VLQDRLRDALSQREIAAWNQTGRRAEHSPRDGSIPMFINSRRLTRWLTSMAKDTIHLARITIGNGTGPGSLVWLVLDVMREEVKATLAGQYAAMG